VIGAPPPRANCGNCYAEGKIFIYGGHGGLGYNRCAYADIYSFDIDSETWQKHEQKGTYTPPPVGRGGNSIFVCNGKLYSYGGWNAESQYEILSVYDLATCEWQEYDDIVTAKPRWNHSSLLVEAIPSWKFFIFGGESSKFNEGDPRSFGEVVNSVAVLDLQTFKWEVIKPESEENLPSPREYTAMINQQNQLIVFGGWNRGWLGDMYGLNVSKIVGPPYAITKIEPALGQLSGGDIVTIRGQGFTDNNC
jgi:dynein heavy chain